jgi:hypothetical protein
MRSEPLWTVAGITAAVSAVIAALAAFGVVPLTETQTTAILGVVGVLAPVVVAWVTRSKVTPVNKASDYPD